MSFELKKQPAEQLAECEKEWQKKADYLKGKKESE